jgi:hypothetical protein
MPSATHSPDLAGNANMRRRASDRPAPGTGLVPLQWIGPAEAPPKSSRPDATFVAHLMAMQLQSPQTRVLRRAAVADVQAAYRSAAGQGQPPAPTGRMHRDI